jgi:hypothetical protein
LLLLLRLRLLDFLLLDFLLLDFLLLDLRLPRLEDFFLLLLFFLGTLAPERRASFKPMAIACLRLFTFLPEDPLRSVPCLRSCIAFFTFDCAFVVLRAAITLSMNYASRDASCDRTIGKSRDAIGHRMNRASVFALRACITMAP